MSSHPPALVMGDLDVVRPLTLAGVRCAVFCTPRDPARTSRLVSERLPWIDHWAEPERVVELVERWAREQPEPPILVPQSDADLLLVSRHRDRLAASCRFLLADADLLEALVDKAQFGALALERGLPVPRAAAVQAGARLAGVEVPLPWAVKPLTWTPAWRAVVPFGKALMVADERERDEVERHVREAGVDVLVQQFVPGPESRIESYHAYVDVGGTIAGEFTGRKIRTWPLEYGDSASVEITDEADVREAGRDVLTRLGLVGLAKCDFKRAPDGSLHLLEINPRASLWLHPGALAGVNLLALLVADLAGAARPATGTVTPGVAWCEPLRDARAARAAGVPLRAWLRFLRRCRAKSAMRWSDPLPVLWRVAMIVRARV